MHTFGHFDTGKQEGQRRLSCRETRSGLNKLWRIL